MRESRIILSSLQRLQLLDADRTSRRPEVSDDAPDQTPPWVVASMTWTEWAAQLGTSRRREVVAPNEATPDVS